MLMSLYPCSSPPSASPSLVPQALLLFRHGERADQVPTDPWYRPRLPRRRDPPLTSRGYAQAADAGVSLLNDGVRAQVVYSSPLTRCLQTAAGLAGALDVPVHVVYSLAKPCKYFRVCMRENIIPEVPNQQETETILRQTNPSVRLSAYTPDNGKSCRRTLEALVQQTALNARNNSTSQHHQHFVTIVAGHSESQAEMARLAGNPLSSAPFCGRATFIYDYSSSTDPVNWSWTLIESPIQHKQRNLTSTLARNTVITSPAHTA